VRLSSRDLYLGPYGSPESEARNESLVAEWLKRDRKMPPKPAGVTKRKNLVVNELILAYIEFAKGYYVKGGQPTGEIANIREVLRVVTTQLESKHVRDFGPGELRRVRDLRVKSGLCRNVVNSRVNRARRMFKWGVEHDRVDPIVWQRLQAISPLREGRSPAQSRPIKPASLARIRTVSARPVLAPAG